MTVPRYVARIRKALPREAISLPSVSAVIRDEEGRIVLVRHANEGRWGVPGGIPELDEPPVRAVAREAREETGLEVVVTRLVGVYAGHDFRVAYPNGDVVSYVVAAFACSPMAGTLRAVAPETLDAQLFTPQETHELLLSGFARALLDRVLHHPRPFDRSDHDELSDRGPTRHGM